MSSILSSADDFRAKKRRLSNPDITNEESMNGKSEIRNAICKIRDELRQTNSILSEVVAEMKRSNNAQQQLVETIATYTKGQAQQHWDQHLSL